MASGAPSTPIRGYWVRSESYYLNSLSIDWLRSQGITDLFVLTDRENPVGTLQPFINKFGGYPDIRIHAWVRTFKDSSGKWYAPFDRPDLNDWVIENTKNWLQSRVWMEFIWTRFDTGVMLLITEVTATIPPWK